MQRLSLPSARRDWTCNRPDLATAAEPAPDRLDADLAKLSAVADSYPPQVKTAAERSSTEALWRSVEARLLRASHDFETELKLGNLYRMGHNLDVEGAWDKAVTHLQEAGRLRPDSPLPLTTLGAHYSGSGRAAEAEAPLLQALALSGDKPSPASTPIWPSPITNWANRRRSCSTRPRISRRTPTLPP